MPRTQAQKDGLAFEKSFATLMGGELKPGSGNKWYALMDVGSRSILWSLKHTGKKSLSVTRGLLSEVAEAASGIGGRGHFPGIAVDIDGEAYVILKAQDFAQLTQEEIQITPPTRADEKRARAAVPQALRSANDQAG